MSNKLTLRFKTGNGRTKSTFFRKFLMKPIFCVSFELIISLFPIVCTRFYMELISKTQNKYARYSIPTFNYKGPVPRAPIRNSNAKE